MCKFVVVALWIVAPEATGPCRPLVPVALASGLLSESSWRNRGRRSGDLQACGLEADPLFRGQTDPELSSSCLATVLPRRAPAAASVQVFEHSAPNDETAEPCRELPAFTFLFVDARHALPGASKCPQGKCPQGRGLLASTAGQTKGTINRETPSSPRRCPQQQRQFRATAPQRSRELRVRFRNTREK